MKVSQILYTVLAMALNVMPAIAEDFSSQVTFRIEAVTERLPLNSNLREASLELRFLNESQHEICVPISGPYGKGSGFPPPIYAIPSERFFLPASFASFKYDWFDIEGKTVCHGEYDASCDDIVLEPRHEKRFWIPIRLPKPGSYKLVVTFANSDLEPARHSYNCRRFNEIFVSREDRASITIKK